MSDEKKFSLAWWHYLIGLVLMVLPAYDLVEHHLGDKAIQRLQSDSAFARSERFARNEWMLPRLKAQWTQGPEQKNLHRNH